MHWHRLLRASCVTVFRTCSSCESDSQLASKTRIEVWGACGLIPLKLADEEAMFKSHFIRYHRLTASTQCLLKYKS